MANVDFRLILSDIWAEPTSAAVTELWADPEQPNWTWKRVTFEQKASGVSLVSHKLKKNTTEFLNQSSTDWSLRRSEGSGWKSLCVNSRETSLIFTMSYASYYINCLVSSSAPPYATTLTDEIVLRPGDALRLQCLAHGTHPIRFRWTRVGGASMSAGAESTKDGLLKIARLKASDSGTYKCVATNHVGSSEALTKVIVRGVWNSEKTFKMFFKSKCSGKL